VLFGFVARFVTYSRTAVGSAGPGTRSARP
jgi:hypothetical protein